jgi:hypothetical protein
MTRGTSRCFRVPEQILLLAAASTIVAATGPGGAMSAVAIEFECGLAIRGLEKHYRGVQCTS